MEGFGGDMMAYPQSIAKMFSEFSHASPGMGRGEEGEKTGWREDGKEEGCRRDWEGGKDGSNRGRGRREGNKEKGGKRRTEG
jgi:hypothetical protein